MGLGIRYNYQRLITFGLIPFLLIYVSSKNKMTLYSFKSSYLKFFILIIIYSLLLIFQSIEMEAAFNNIIQLIGVMLASIIVLELMNYKKENLLSWTLISFVLGFYVSIFFLNESLAEEVSLSSQWIDRSNYDLNANKYSYFSFIANFALFYLVELKRSKIYVLLSFVTLGLGIYISFLTASRSGFLFTTLIGVIYWLFIFNKTGKSFRIQRFLLILLVIAFASQKIYETYSSSYLKNRVERANENGDSRVGLAKDALNVFFDHPFTGVGPAQFAFYGKFNRGSYSHNSYLEAATNLGVVGVFLLILLLFSPLVKAFKEKKSRLPSLRLLNILFFFCFILYNNFYVFYWSSVEMMFFFITTQILLKYQVKETDI